MISSDWFLVLLFLVYITIVNIISDCGGVELVIHKFEPFILLKVPVFSLSENVNEINTLHKDKELFEIQTSEFHVGFEFAEHGIQDCQLQFLGRTFTVTSGLFELSPVQGSGVQFVLTNSHEHIVFVEDGHESQEFVRIGHFLIPSRVVFQDMEEHLLLVFGEVNIGQHNGRGTSLDTTLRNKIALGSTLLPSYCGSSKENVFVKVKT